MARKLETGTIKMFKGINRFSTATTVGADFALDCCNVFVSRSGGLEKMKKPSDLHAVFAGVASGPEDLFDFQQAGVRQIVCRSGNRLYYIDQTDWTYHLINDDPLNSARWSAADSNMMKFLCNGNRMLKWAGPAGLSNWGIDRPLLAPVIQPAGWDLDATAGQGAVLVGNVATYKTQLPHCIQVGQKVTVAGVANAIFNVVNAVVTAVPDNTHFSVAIVAANTTSQGGQAKVVGLTIANGRKWRYSYKNSVTQHESSMSDWSPSSGAIADQGQIMQAAAPLDPQVDTICWYCTQNNGSDPQFHSEVPVAQLQTIDIKSDNDLNYQRHGSYINEPPPQGRYLAVWQGRIFIFNLEGAPHDVAYTGYEKILIGRPEESCPPGNRLRLAIGADEIRGGGVIQTGVIAFSKSNEMFMFRGVPEDIVSNQPVAFTAVLEQLPFSEGLTSHWTCQSTNVGLVFQGADRAVKIYDGTGKPEEISLRVNPILKSSTPGTEQDNLSVYFNYLDRNWYGIALKTGGEVVNYNKLILFDLEPNEENNLGIFVSDIVFQNIGVIEDENGARRLVVSQDGIIKELSVISSAINGINPDGAAGTNGLKAWYRTGYFGNESPTVNKIHRYGRLVTDGEGFSIVGRYVDDEKRTVTKPEEISCGIKDGKAVYNRKAKRMSVEIRFPDDDRAASVLEYSHISKELSER